MSGSRYVPNTCSDASFVKPIEIGGKSQATKANDELRKPTHGQVAASTLRANQGDTVKNDARKAIAMADEKYRNHLGSERTCCDELGAEGRVIAAVLRLDLW